MSKRSGIVNGLVSLFKTIDGTGTFNTNLFSNVENRLRFLDEVSDYPYVCVYAGDETREYLPSNFKWAFLVINIRIYVSDEDPVALLENILEDIEVIVDSNNSIEYEPGKFTEEIRITSISTDEGTLTPYGVGEMSLVVRYYYDS